MRIHGAKYWPKAPQNLTVQAMWHVGFSSLTVGKMAKQATRFAILIQLFFSPVPHLGEGGVDKDSNSFAPEINL